MAARARVKAGTLIEKEIGGTLGGILSGVIGGQKPVIGTAPNSIPAETGASSGDAAQEDPAAPFSPQTTIKDQAEEKAEEAVKDFLGGFLGSKKKTSETPPED